MNKCGIAMQWNTFSPKDRQNTDRYYNMTDIQKHYNK